MAVGTQGAVGGPARALLLALPPPGLRWGGAPLPAQADLLMTRVGAVGGGHWWSSVHIALLR